MLGVKTSRGFERQLPIIFRSHQAGRRVPGGMRAASRASQAQAGRSLPRCRETRERNRAGHTLPAPGLGYVRPFSVIPAKAGISGGKNTNLPKHPPSPRTRSGVSFFLSPNQRQRTPGSSLPWACRRLRGGGQGIIRFVYGVFRFPSTADGSAPEMDTSFGWADERKFPVA